MTDPLLRALTRAEGVLEAELGERLARWDRVAREPTPIERQALFQLLAARLQAMAEQAADLQRRAWAKIETKSAATLAAGRAEWVKTRAAELVVRLSDEQRERVAAAIRQGLAENLTTDQLRRRLAGLIQGLPNGGPKVRAARIARTELHNAATFAQEQEALELRRRGVDLVKVWTATLDKRTRRAHRKANGQVRELDAKFTVGGAAMDRPGDPRGGPANVIQCRCVARYLPRRQVTDDRQRRADAFARALTSRRGDTLDALEARALEADEVLAQETVRAAAARSVGQGRRLAIEGDEAPAWLDRLGFSVTRRPGGTELGPAAVLASADDAILWAAVLDEFLAAAEVKP